LQKELVIYLSKVQIYSKILFVCFIRKIDFSKKRVEGENESIFSKSNWIQFLQKKLVIYLSEVQIYSKILFVCFIRKIDFNKKRVEGENESTFSYI
jgi:hypothetical protein